MRLLFLFMVFNFYVTYIDALSDIFVFHINGINTTRMRAENNTRALEMSVKDKSKTLPHNRHFDLLYNNERNATFCNLCKQLIDVWHQKNNEDKTIDDYVLTQMKAQNLNYAVGSLEYNKLKQSIKRMYFEDPMLMGDVFSDISQQFHRIINLSDRHKHRNMHEFVKTNSVANVSGKPYILLIPHSQGNFYANRLYDKLTQMDGYDDLHLSIYGIASPAEKNSGNWISKNIFSKDGYITSSNDVIINALRIIASTILQHKVLPANVDIPTGHSLIATYLSHESSRVQIVDTISDILQYYQTIDLYAQHSKVSHKNGKSSV
jgi:hypothetical protein